jgi:hypothetical protein
MRPLIALVPATLLVAACGAGTHIATPIATPIASSPMPTPCEAGRYRLHGTAIADYLEFVQLKTTMFVEPRVLGMKRGVVRAKDLGVQVATVKCKLDASDIDSTKPLRDGDSSFVEAGTAVYAVKGYSPSCRVAAEQLGKLTVFVATKQGGEHIAAACSAK